MDILGTEYELVVDQSLLENEDAAGICEPYAKQIRVSPENEMLGDTYTAKEKRGAFEQTLRHEIIHAFFYESGDINAGDEKLVEWLSVQIPKMAKLFKEYGCSGED